LAFEVLRREDSGNGTGRESGMAEFAEASVGLVELGVDSISDIYSGDSPLSLEAFRESCHHTV